MLQPWIPFSGDAQFFFFYVAQFSFSNLLMITFNAPFVQSIAAAMTHFPPQGSLKFNFIQSKNSAQNVFACKWQLQRSVIALISVRFMSCYLSDTVPGKPISLLAKQTDANGGRLRRLLGNLGAREEEEAKRVFTPDAHVECKHWAEGVNSSCVGCTNTQCPFLLELLNMDD